MVAHRLACSAAWSASARVLYALADRPAGAADAAALHRRARPSGRGGRSAQRRVAMSAEASGATITSTAVNRSSVSQVSRRMSTRPRGDRRPHLAGREVVEHDDAARLDQVGHGVDAGVLGDRGVQEQQRVGALVAQRRPVGGEHLDLRVVGEDLLRRVGQVGRRARRRGSGCRGVRRSAATPCRPRSRCRTPPSCRRGSPPAWPAADRSRCGRRTRSPRAGRRRTPARRSRAPRAGRSCAESRKSAGADQHW